MVSKSTTAWRLSVITAAVPRRLGKVCAKIVAYGLGFVGHVNYGKDAHAARKMEKNVHHTVTVTNPD